MVWLLRHQPAECTGWRGKHRSVRHGRCRCRAVDKRLPPCAAVGGIPLHRNRSRGNARHSHARHVGTRRSQVNQHIVDVGIPVVVTANARTTQKSNVLARATIGCERHIVAVPFVTYNIQCVYHLQRAVHRRVVHHAYHHAGGVVAIVYILYILCPERQLQPIHRQHRRIDSGQHNLLVDHRLIDAPFPTHHAAARMGVARQIDNTGVRPHPALPAGNGGGAGGDGVVVEILRVGQRVEQAAEGAEHHHWRPMRSVAAALGPHIHIILRVGQQPRQQQAVGAHIGDNGSRVGHKACRAVGHIIIYRPCCIGPTH